MKRILSILLSLYLLASLSCASAQADDVLRVLDSWWAADRYQEAYPDRQIRTLERYDETGESLIGELLQSGEWDAICAETTELSLAELSEKGLLLDMNGIPAIAEKAKGLYPSIRAACSAGEKLVALPAGYLSMSAYRYWLIGTDFRGNADTEAAALRDRLGFTESDQPKSFADVCMLGLRYMALDRETRKGTSFLFSDSAPQGYRLLDMLLETYQAEMMDAQGCVTFDTPAFRSALACAQPLLEAFKADPKNTYDENGTLHMVLIETPGAESYGVFPTVLGSDALPAHMTVVIVNPNSLHLQEAIDYALIAAEGGEALLLYENADYDTQLQKSYDESIAAQIEQGEAQSVIDELEACKKAGSDKYFTPKRTIERFASEIAPHLTFPRAVYIPTEDAVQDYLTGKLDTDGFIAALDEAAKQQ